MTCRNRWRRRGRFRRRHRARSSGAIEDTAMQGKGTSEPPVKGFDRGCCLLNNNQVSQSALKPRYRSQRQDVPCVDVDPLIAPEKVLE